jgi:hypothetical protein
MIETQGYLKNDKFSLKEDSYAGQIPAKLCSCEIPSRVVSVPICCFPAAHLCKAAREES